MPTEKPAHTGHRSRLRKRFRQGGLNQFLDHEVVEMLLTYAIPRRDVKPLAWDLIKKYGSLSRVLDAMPEEITAVPGMGEEAATFVAFVRALMRRYFLDDLKQKQTIRSPEDVVHFCRASLEGEKDESFEVLYLTTRNTVIDAERLSTGTIDRATVSPRKVVENALKARAAAMIFVHNHPSGNPSPSQDDLNLTTEITRAAQGLGIAVHDHIIVGKGNYYSFRANGLIKKEGK